MMYIQTATRLLGLSILLAVCGCRLAGEPPGLPEDPTCIAQDADGREVTCAAPPRAYSGDRCTCVNAETRAAFVGRVKGGM